MARRKKGNPVHGWLVLDKPLNMTSTQAVGAVRRAFNAQKAGHSGTLDPLATGILPIALGEATKTVSFAVDGEKAYRFTVRWGAETRPTTRKARSSKTSDDASGAWPISKRCCRSSTARSCRCRRPIRRSRSMARGPMIWRATARPSCSSRARF